eukprot:1207354-Amphidinium_carterae.3
MTGCLSCLMDVLSAATCLLRDIPCQFNGLEQQVECKTSKDPRDLWKLSRVASVLSPTSNACFQ